MRTHSAVTTWSGRRTAASLAPAASARAGRRESARGLRGRASLSAARGRRPRACAAAAREAVDAHEAAVGGAGDGLADVQARRDPGGDRRAGVAGRRLLVHEEHVQRPEPRRRRQRVGAARVHAVAHQQAAAPRVAAALQLGVAELQRGRDVGRRRRRAPPACGGPARPPRPPRRSGRRRARRREQHHREVAGVQLEREHGRGDRGERHLLPGHAQRGVDHEHDLVPAVDPALHDQVAGLRMRLAEQVLDRRLHVELAAPRLQQRLAHGPGGRLERPDEAAGSLQHRAGRELLGAQPGALAGVVERSRAQVAGELPAVQVLGRRAQLPRERAAVRPACRPAARPRPCARPRRPPAVPAAACRAARAASRRPPAERGGRERRVRVLPAARRRAPGARRARASNPPSASRSSTRACKRGLGGAAQRRGPGAVAPWHAARRCRGQLDDRRSRRAPTRPRRTRGCTRVPRVEPHRRRAPARRRGTRSTPRRSPLPRRPSDSPARGARTGRGSPRRGGRWRRTRAGFCVATTWKPSAARTGAEVRHLHDALVERRQQQVLRGLGQAVQLVHEEDTALAHRPAPAARRRMPPRGSRAPGPAAGRTSRRAGSREAVVAVDAHGAAAEPPADGERQRRLARADRPLKQQVPAAGRTASRISWCAISRCASDHDARTVATSMLAEHDRRRGTDSDWRRTAGRPGRRCRPREREPEARRPGTRSGASGLRGTPACASPWYSRGATSLGPSA